MDRYDSEADRMCRQACVPSHLRQDGMKSNASSSKSPEVTSSWVRELRESRGDGIWRQMHLDRGDGDRS